MLGGILPRQTTWHRAQLALAAVWLSAAVSAQEDGAGRSSNVACEVRSGATVLPMGESFNITSTNSSFLDNPDGKIVLDIVLTDQDAVIDLPGMIVRLRSGADSDADGSGDDGVEDDGLGDGLDMDDLDSLKQGIGDIVAGNLLSIIICLCSAVAIIEIEKKYKCIGGEKIHRLVEEQHQLTEDVGSVVHLVKTIKETGQGVVDPATGEVSSGNLMQNLMEHQSALHGMEKMMASHLGTDKFHELKDKADKMDHHEDFQGYINNAKKAGGAATDKMLHTPGAQKAAKNAADRAAKAHMDPKKYAALKTGADKIEHDETLQGHLKEAGKMGAQGAQKLHGKVDEAHKKKKHSDKHSKTKQQEHSVLDGAKSLAGKAGDKVKAGGANLRQAQADSSLGEKARHAKDSAVGASKSAATKGKDVAAQHGVTAESTQAATSKAATALKEKATNAAGEDAKSKGKKGKPIKKASKKGAKGKATVMVNPFFAASQEDGDD